MHNQNMTYRPEIDGLRAIAVLPVILFHAGIDFFSGGYVGVDVFFVISGYLITTILIREQEKEGISIAQFYKRRAKRILPALFTVVLVTLPAAWIYLPPKELESYFASIAATATFSSNILFWYQAGYWDTETALKPLIHTWSLAVEEQYYLVFPLLVMAAWRLGARTFSLIIASMSIASLLLAQALLDNHPMLSFYMLPTRAWELLAGSLAAIYLLRRDRPIGYLPVRQLSAFIGIGIIAYCCSSYTEQTAFPGIAALLPVAGAVMIILFADAKTVVGKALASRPLVLVGLLSYSAYLWHQPILAFMKIQNSGDLSAMHAAIAIVITFCLSVLSYRLVETPIRKGGSVFGTRPLQTSTATIILFAAVGLFGVYKQGFPERISNLYSAESRFAEQQLRDSLVTDTDPSSNKPVVLILGDSFLFNWAAGLSSVIDTSKFRVVSLSYLGCDVAIRGDAVSVTIIDVKREIGCRQLEEYMNDSDFLARVSSVIMTTHRFYEYRLNDFRFDLMRRIADHSDGASIYVFGSYYQISNKTICLQEMFRTLSAADRCLEIADYPSASTAEISAFAKSKNVPEHTYIDVIELLCDYKKESCPSEYEGVPFITDWNHLTATFVKHMMLDIMRKQHEYLTNVGLAQYLKRG